MNSADQEGWGCVVIMVVLILCITAYNIAHLLLK